MTMPRRVLQFYLDASFHVALVLTALTYVCATMMHLKVKNELLALNFCVALAGYNLIKYGQLWLVDYRVKIRTLILTILAGIVALSLLFFETIEVWIAIAMVTIFSALYAIPFSYGLSLRRLPVVKLISVGLVWAIICVCVPVHSNYSATNLFYNFSDSLSGLITIIPTIDWFLFLRIVILVFVWCLPFEIRDLKYDQQDLKTLPQLVGVTTTKWIGLALLTVLAINLLIFETAVDANLFTELSIYAASGLLLYFSNEKRPDAYASLVVESLPILWLVLIIIT